MFLTRGLRAPLWTARLQRTSRIQQSSFHVSLRRLKDGKPPPDLRKGIPKVKETPQNTSSEPPPGSNPAPDFQGLPDLRNGIPDAKDLPGKADNDNSSDVSNKVPSFQDLPDLRHGIPSQFGNEGQGGTAVEPVDIKEQPKEEYVSSIDRRRQAFARWMYITFASFGVAAFLWLGRDWEDEGHEAPNGLTPVAWYKRFRERLGGQFSHYTEPAFPKLLPDQPSDPTQRAPYTLVLSLEDLLVTSTWTRQDGYKTAKRPGVDYFIRYLCQYYEMVIFTTVQAASGDLVYRQLDPYQLCMPIFRDGTRYMDGEHVKVCDLKILTQDLSYLNRDLSKTIIIDTNPEHTKLQPENAIILPKWKGAPGDPHATDLVALIPFLEYIAGMELQDVRKVIESYKGTDIPKEFHRRELVARREFEKQVKPKKSRVGLGSSLGLKPMHIPGEQSPAEAFAEGKMLIDVVRERGKRQYLDMEKMIRDNGEQWLKQRADEEKKMQEEGMRHMTTGVADWFGGK